MTTEQLAFPFAAVDDAGRPLVCAFGEPWLGAHPKCDAAVRRACLRFDAAVRRGEYDREGYTPLERRLQQRKAAAR